jgi:hypothetical protein
MAPPKFADLAKKFKDLASDDFGWFHTFIASAQLSSHHRSLSTSTFKEALLRSSTNLIFGRLWHCQVHAQVQDLGWCGLCVVQPSRRAIQIPQNLKLEESLNIASQSYGGLVELKYTNAAHGMCGIPVQPRCVTRAQASPSRIPGTPRVS